MENEKQSTHVFFQQVEWYCKLLGRDVSSVDWDKCFSGLDHISRGITSPSHVISLYQIAFSVKSADSNQALSVSRFFYSFLVEKQWKHTSTHWSYMKAVLDVFPSVFSDIERDDPKRFLSLKFSASLTPEKSVYRSLTLTRMLVEFSDAGLYGNIWRYLKDGALRHAGSAVLCALFHLNMDPRRYHIVSQIYKMFLPQAISTVVTHLKKTNKRDQDSAAYIAECELVLNQCWEFSPEVLTHTLVDLLSAEIFNCSDVLSLCTTLPQSAIRAWSSSRVIPTHLRLPLKIFLASVQQSKSMRHWFNKHLTEQLEQTKVSESLTVLFQLILQTNQSIRECVRTSGIIRNHEVSSQYHKVSIFTESILCDIFYVLLSRRTAFNEREYEAVLVFYHALVHARQTMHSSLRNVITEVTTLEEFCTTFWAGVFKKPATDIMESIKLLKSQNNSTQEFIFYDLLDESQFFPSYSPEKMLRICEFIGKSIQMKFLPSDLHDSFSKIFSNLVTYQIEIKEKEVIPDLEPIPVVDLPVVELKSEPVSMKIFLPPETKVENEEKTVPKPNPVPVRELPISTAPAESEKPAQGSTESTTQSSSSHNTFSKITKVTPVTPNPGSGGSDGPPPNNNNNSGPPPQMEPRKFYGRLTADALFNLSVRLLKLRSPVQGTIDYLNFALNSVDEKNSLKISEGIRNSLFPDTYRFFIYTLVAKRITSDAKLHHTYFILCRFLALNNDVKIFHLLREATFFCIDALLHSALTQDERVMLKNLGTWIGSITLEQDSYLFRRRLDLKRLLIESCLQAGIIVLDGYGMPLRKYQSYQLYSSYLLDFFRRFPKFTQQTYCEAVLARNPDPNMFNLKKILDVVPFVCNVLERCVKSKVFKPPNPWIMGLLAFLSELATFATERKILLSIEISVLNLFEKLKVQPEKIPATRHFYCFLTNPNDKRKYDPPRQISQNTLYHRIFHHLMSIKLQVRPVDRSPLTSVQIAQAKLAYEKLQQDLDSGSLTVALTRELNHQLKQSSLTQQQIQQLDTVSRKMYSRPLQHLTCPQLNELLLTALNADNLSTPDLKSLHNRFHEINRVRRETNGFVSVPTRPVQRVVEPVVPEEKKDSFDFSDRERIAKVFSESYQLLKAQKPFIDVMMPLVDDIPASNFGITPTELKTFLLVGMDIAFRNECVSSIEKSCFSCLHNNKFSVNEGSKFQTDKS